MEDEERSAENLVGLGADVSWPDADALADARRAGAVGTMAALAEWLAGAQGAYPPRRPTRVRLVRYGVASEPADTLAAEAGIGVRALDGTTFEDGVRAADDEVDSGADLLLVSGVGDFSTCALAVSAITNAEPVALLPRGAAAVDTAAWVARAELLRDRRPALLEARHSSDELLAVLDDAALNVVCGFVARAASRRTPLVLDGELAAAAALVAHASQSRFDMWWRVADTSSSPALSKSVDAFRQRPVLDLGIETSDGLAALLAAGALQTAIAIAAIDRPLREGGVTP